MAVSSESLEMSYGLHRMQRSDLMTTNADKCVPIYPFQDVNVNASEE